ncbi:MAG: beta-L-arabinofuranosidase domain-containing protein [Chloroflexota bacterium]
MTIPAELRASALRELPLGAVRPAGWLLEQLHIQALGLTGSLESTWEDVGPRSGWLGGDGEDWERGPYYLDGLVPLAHLTGDPALIARAQRWIEWMLASSRPDGFFGPASNEDWWPRMVALKVLMQHHDATGDARVPEMMSRYFRYHLAHAAEHPLRDWGRVRGADEMLAVAWLWEKTHEPHLLELWAVLAEQTADWGAWLQAPPTEVTAAWDHMTHVVNVAMGLKTPALRALSGDPAEQLRLSDTGWERLSAAHGQVHGMFSGDEWLAGTEARRGVELCAVVEAMFSFAQMARIWGTAHHGDLLERLAYNLLPGTFDARMTAHQYHQQANQVLCTVARRDWTQAGDDCTIFGLEPSFGCCTANMHQGWPKLVRSLWMATDDDGLAAVAWGPCDVRHVLPGGYLHLEVRTGYPFEEEIAVRVVAAPGTDVPLRLRIPAWCTAPELTIGGASVPAVVEDGWLRISRAWQAGDTLVLTLPMTVRAARRPSGGVGLTLGPLVLAYWPGEIWERLPDSPGFGDWEVRPRRGWNAALVIDPETVHEVARVERLGVQSPPFGSRVGSPPWGMHGVPLKVWIPGRRAPSWDLVAGDAGPVPPPDATPSWDFDHPFPLIPYGSTRLRIAELALAAPSTLGRRGLDDPPA